MEEPLAKIIPYQSDIITAGGVKEKKREEPEGEGKPNYLFGKLRPYVFRGVRTRRALEGVCGGDRGGDPLQIFTDRRRVPFVWRQVHQERCERHG